MNSLARIVILTRPAEAVTAAASVAAAAALTCALACGASRPAPEAAGPTAAAAEVESLRTRFAEAYFAIACMANQGRDPETSFTPLRKPLDYLEGLEAEKSPKLARVSDILMQHGFAAIQDFRVVEARLRADPKWWTDRIDAPFVDELKKCP